MKKAREIEYLVRAVCVQDGFLLVCRRRGASYCYLPGGHIEPDEAARSALRRELLEELGRRAVIGEFLGAMENRYEKSDGSPVHELNLLFAARFSNLRTTEPLPTAEPRLVFEWIALAALKRSDLQPRPLRQVLALPPPPGGWGWLSAMEKGRRPR